MFEVDYFIPPLCLVPKLRSVAQNEWKKHPYTGCPTDMVTRSDQILKIEKLHMTKSKPCFEILE